MRYEDNNKKEDGYHQSFSDLTDTRGYYNSGDNYIEDSIQLAGLVAASGATSLYIHSHGGFREFMHRFVRDVSENKGTQTLNESLKAMNRYTGNKDHGTMHSAVAMAVDMAIPNAIKKAAGESVVHDFSKLDSLKIIQERSNALEALKRFTNQHNISKEATEKMNNETMKSLQDVLKGFQVNYGNREKLMNTVGWAPATIGELMDGGKLDDIALERIKRFEGSGIGNLRGLIGDKNILVDKKGEFISLHSLFDSTKQISKTLINDLQIPLLNISVPQMFQFEELLKLNDKPVFSLLDPSEVQPLISGSIDEIARPMIYSFNKIIDGVTGDVIKDGIDLKPVVGMHSKNLRKMSGIEVSTNYQKWKGKAGTAYYKAMEKLDLGFQDNLWQEKFKLSDPGSWLPGITQKTSDLFSPIKSKVDGNAKKPFGDKTKWIVSSKTKSLGTDGSLKQIFAGRDNLEDVTSMTMYPYMLMERVNSGLNQLKLGLGVESVGSAQDVFVNLMAKRILPVVVGLGAIKYAKYEYKKLTNKDADEKIADTYVTASVNVTKIRDAFGITDMMKKLSNIVPGWDQLEELPILGKIFSTKDAVETSEYWKYGSDPVRKGRWWSLGNTAFTGGKIDYYQPNWARRKKSNYKFTEVLYGSEDEYFANWFLPTLRHPFAPIKRFITDPYHYEKKHYYDRPYPISGGIPELAEIPIIGGILDGTIGRILKPRKKMHEEYWGKDGLPEASTQEPSLYAKLALPGVRAEGFPGRHAIPEGDKEDEAIVYSTSSGNLDIMSKPKDMDIHGLNWLLKKASIKQQVKISTIQMGESDYGVTDTEEDPVMPRGLEDITNDTLDDMKDMAGFYGFSASLMAPDDLKKRKPEVESSLKMTSYSRSFWDNDYGGFGGNLSEIFRRFVPRKSAMIEQINPIRNRMACLLGNTDVLLFNGRVIRADGVRIGDELVSKDGDKTTVEQIATFSAKEIISIGLFTDDVSVTRFSWNHPIYTDKHKFVHAIDIVAGDYVSFPIRSYKNTEKLNFNIDDHINEETDMQSDLDTSTMWLEEDMFYLIGMYAAAGFVEDGAVRIDVSKSVFTIALSTISIISKYGIKYDMDYQRGQLIIHSKVLSDALVNICPGIGMNKHLTNVVTSQESSASSIDSLLRGVKDCFSKDVVLDQEISFQIRNMIINREKYAPSLTKRIESGLVRILVGINNKENQYSDETHVYLKVRYVDVANKNTMVYGYQVDGDHTFCTASIATHNTWLPGSEYYIDFQHGDPFTKVQNGEYRLPGEGYEKMRNKRDPAELWIGGSKLGFAQEDIVKSYLQADDIEFALNPNISKILSNGTRVHDKVEKDWEKLGFAVQTEGYVKDDKLKIEGYYDAMVVDNTSKTGHAIVDIKTISDKGYHNLDKDGPKKENVAQLNFYMYKTGQSKGYLHYINHEDPDAPTKTIELHYDEKLLRSSLRDLEAARGFVKQGLQTGIIARGDLYSIMDRFRILADVAPYSDNYRYYNTLLSKSDLKESQKKEVAQIRKQVTSRKDQLRFYDYKFKTSDTKKEFVTVKGLNDDGTILTKEYDRNPIKLAGVKFSTNKDTEKGREALEYLGKRIKKGQKIEIEYDTDPNKKFRKDTYKTLNAVVNFRGKNMNREMLEQDLAEERESDNSAPGIHARFSKGEIVFGKVAESLSHMDTMFNTKFMQVRSPLEQYKRRDLYGKDWQSWNNPIRDFLIPSIESRASKDPLLSVGLGVVLGSMFGRTKTTKIIAGTLGAAVVGGLSTQRVLREKITGETWIPNRRRKERDINEYVDKLKYVKNMKLYEEYRQEAIKKENIDPAEIIRENKDKGRWRKSRIEYLSSIKRKLNNKTMSLLEAKGDSGIDIAKEAKTEKELVSMINKEITSLKNHREAQPVGSKAAQAIMYYNESEKTAHGYDPGEPMQNVLASLNRRERRYFMPFLEAPEHERAEILKLVPSYMKRPLQSAYGLEVDEKTDLESYFKDHYLPDDNWAGWDPGVSLEDVKVKIVQHEGMDIGEFDKWDNDVVKASQLNIPVPMVNTRQSISVIRKRLTDVLSAAGLTDVYVEAHETDDSRNDIDVSVINDRRGELEGYISNYGLL